MSSLLQPQQLLNQVITANFTGGWVQIPEATMLDVVVVLTAGAGTPTIDVFLDASHDAIEDAPLPLDTGVAGVTAAAPKGVIIATPRVAIIDAKSNTTSEKARAIYKHVPAGYIRPRVNISGAGASFNVKIIVGGK